MRFWNVFGETIHKNPQKIMDRSEIISYLFHRDRCGLIAVKQPVEGTADCFGDHPEPLVLMDLSSLVVLERPRGDADEFGELRLVEPGRASSDGDPMSDLSYLFVRHERDRRHSLSVCPAVVI